MSPVTNRVTTNAKRPPSAEAPRGRNVLHSNDGGGGTRTPKGLRPPHFEGGRATFGPSTADPRSPRHLARTLGDQSGRSPNTPRRSRSVVTISGVILAMLVVAGCDGSSPMAPADSSGSDLITSAVALEGVEQPAGLTTCVYQDGPGRGETGRVIVGSRYRWVRVGTCTEWDVRGVLPVRDEVPPGLELVRIVALLRDGGTVDLPLASVTRIDVGVIQKVVFHHRVLPLPLPGPPASVHMQEGAQRVVPDPDGWCRTTVRLTALYGPVVVRDVRVVGIVSDISTPLSVSLQEGESLVVQTAARAYEGGARNVGIHATWSQLDAAHRIGSSSRGFVCGAP